MRRLTVVPLLLALATPATADSIFVQARQAELRSEPGFDQPVVAELVRGTELTRVGERGRWLRVRTDAAEGWVFRFLVANHAPVEKQTVLGDSGESVGEGARRRASQVTTAGAARGLTAAERKRLSHAGGADYQALERLEAMAISDAEVRRFLRGDQ
jgi:hypothetical protein